MQNKIILLLLSIFVFANSFAMRGRRAGQAGQGQRRVSGASMGSGIRNPRVGINPNIQNIHRQTISRQNLGLNRSNLNRNLFRPQSQINSQQFSNISNIANPRISASRLLRPVTPVAPSQVSRNTLVANQNRAQMASAADIRSRLNPIQANPNRLRDTNYTRKFNQQRDFLNRDFRGHRWSWWWQNNPSYFLSAFPVVYYDTYGYYPPIYDDYYENFRNYPATIDPYSEYGPEYYTITYDNTADNNQNRNFVNANIPNMRNYEPDLQTQISFPDCVVGCKNECAGYGYSEKECHNMCKGQCTERMIRNN